MSTTNTSVSPPGTADGFRTARRGGQAVTAVIVAWVVFAVADRLESVGRHFLVLGVLRMALLAALLGFAAAFVDTGHSPTALGARVRQRSGHWRTWSVASAPS